LGLADEMASLAPALRPASVPVEHRPVNWSLAYFGLTDALRFPRESDARNQEREGQPKKRLPSK
jgi:hypothetical protein